MPQVSDSCSCRFVRALPLRGRGPRSRTRSLSFLVVLLFGALAIATTASAGGGRSGKGGPGRCFKPVDPGLHVVDVVQDGVHRPFQLWVPAGCAGRRVPLLFWLHGSTSSGEAAMATRDAAGNLLFPDDADEHGYAVATPTGAVPFSPAPDTLDDIGYIDLAIDAISDLICVDDRRVYASGSSGGGRMASQLACDLSDRIAAIAPVMGVRAPRASDTPGFTVECAPTRRVPVVAIHGRLDPVNPFPDDSPELVPGSSWTYGVPEAMERWAELNGCAPVAPKRKAVSENVDRVRYRGCRGAPVVLYDVLDGGHTLPGTLAVPALVPFVGPTNQEIDTADTVWSFLSRFRLRGPR